MTVQNTIFELQDPLVYYCRKYGIFTNELHTLAVNNLMFWLKVKKKYQVTVTFGLIWAVLPHKKNDKKVFCRVKKSTF